MSGHHNLAALELKRGDLAAARQGFLGEREAHERLLAMLPGDAELQASIANVDSYLGSIAERHVTQTEVSGGHGPDLTSTEPNLAWQLVSLGGDVVTIRVFVSLESAPPEDVPSSVELRWRPGVDHAASS